MNDENNIFPSAEVVDKFDGYYLTVGVTALHALSTMLAGLYAGYVNIFKGNYEADEETTHEQMFDRVLEIIDDISCITQNWLEENRAVTNCERSYRIWNTATRENDKKPDEIKIDINADLYYKEDDEESKETIKESN